MRCVGNRASERRSRTSRGKSASEKSWARTMKNDAGAATTTRDQDCCGHAVARVGAPHVESRERRPPLQRRRPARARGPCRRGATRAPWNVSWPSAGASCQPSEGTAAYATRAGSRGHGRSGHRPLRASARPSRSARRRRSTQRRRLRRATSAVRRSAAPRRPWRSHRPIGCRACADSLVRVNGQAIHSASGTGTARSAAR